jgi:hypothetical protein
MHHLRLVLQRLREHKLYAQLPKCDFGLSELKFLGHIVGEAGVRPDPDKVRAVQEWPEPSNAAELRSFLGLAQYFRKFIQGYAQTVCCLYDLLKTNAVFNFTDKHKHAFEQVKYSLVHAPVLRAPNFKQPFELWTDASTHGIGAVLMQEGHPVAYESRKLSSAEFNYTTTEQELLAVVHSLKTFRPYIQSKFTTNIFTDHRALEWLLTKQDVSRREARWLEEISRYNLKLSYIPGRINVADPISRVPALMHFNVGWLHALTRSQARAQQQPAAPPSGPVEPPPATEPRRKGKKKRKVTISEPTASTSHPDKVQDVSQEQDEPTVTQLLQQLADAYVADVWFQHKSNLSRNAVSLRPDGLYYRDGPKGTQLVIPDDKQLKQAIIREHHDPPYAGHRGYRSTEHLVQRLYWWPHMHKDIQQYVESCAGCQANKASTCKPTGVAKSMPVPEKPWEKFSMDWMTDLPVTKHGFDSILVVVDYLTKFAHFVPCKKTDTSSDVASLLRREVVRLHGVPEVIVSDRDPKLMSNYMQDLFLQLGVKHTPSTAFHPQTDGQTERLNRVVQEMLRNYVSPLHDDWDEYLDLAEFAYNNSYHESIKTTPFRLTYGLDPRNPMSSIKLATNVDGKSVDLSFIHAGAMLCSFRSTTIHPHNVPQCMGATKYYQSPAGIAHLRAISPKEIPECPAARKFTSYMQQQLQHARRCLEAAKQRQRAHAQKRMSDATYQVGDYVWLSTVNLRNRLQGTPKFMPKFVGPFKIDKVVNESTYMLDIGETKKKIHNVFHSSLLKRCKGPAPSTPLPIILREHADNIGAYQRYEVEMILKHRLTHRSRRKADGTMTAKRADGVEYLIKWKGYDAIHNTWEPARNVDRCETLLQEYWQKWSRKNPGKTPLM